VRDALLAFHAQHYSANNMRLAIVGRGSSCFVFVFVLKKSFQTKESERED
jgi:secreted Zn-dependent insulinase-like peptidase